MFLKIEKKHYVCAEKQKRNKLKHSFICAICFAIGLRLVCRLKANCPLVGSGPIGFAIGKKKFTWNLN